MKRSTVFARVRVQAIVVLLVALSLGVALAQGAPQITVEHDRGSLTFESIPERVVVVGDEMAELVVALGVKPVGFASGRLQGGQLGQGVVATSYLDKDLLGEPVFVGGLEPSLEAILSLQPDLILYLNYDDKVYEGLSRIAPTLAYNVQQAGSWKDAIRKVGTALGREEKAEEVVEAFNTRRQALRERLTPVVARAPDITALYLPDPETTFVFSAEFAFASLLQDLGFTLVVPEGAQLENGFGNLSTEVIPSLETDSIITLRFTDERGQLTSHSADDLLALSDAPVLPYVLDPEQPYTGPYSERAFLEGFTQLLLEAHGAGS